MAQKINPIFFRKNKYNNLSLTKAFFHKREDYSNFVIRDIKCRNMISKEYRSAQISKILISHTSQGSINLSIFVAKTSAIIGKQGELVEKLKKKVCKTFDIAITNLVLNIIEEKKPDISANILATKAAEQIEGRASFKRVMKGVIDLAVKNGVKGVKMEVSGRLGGAEIARTVVVTKGSVPRHTISAKIDYSCLHARTIYGIIGIKMTVCLH